MDVLEDILGSLRLTGGVIVDSQLTGEFCLNARFTPEECAPFFPVPDTLIGYHYVRSGNAIIQVQGQEPVRLSRGDIAILPRNDPHLISSRSGLSPADASEIAWITDDGVHRISTGTDGPTTMLWCGFLGTTEGGGHPILNALPPLLTLRTRNRSSEWLDNSLRFLAEELPSRDVVSRLAELFLGQAIREYVDQLPLSSKGWLRGLADPAVSRALSVIHVRYAEELDVETLAREAGVSRTVLGERFAELIGEPPMRYCARWRMRVAANMLREGKEKASNVAYSVGFNSEAAFNRAFKREYGEPPATWRRKTEDEARARVESSRTGLPEQVVRYCTAKDGTRLAFSVVGSGPPLVKAANWLNHLEHDWKSPVWRHWLHELTRGHTLIRYDERANGMSDWDTPEISFEAFVDDLECVVDAAGVDRFDLLAISQGAAVAIAYAVRHPERVRKLVILGGYAVGWAKRNDPDEIAKREAMVALTEAGWGADHPAYRQLFTNLYIPGGTAEQVDWFNELQRASASPANAVKLQRALSVIDVHRLLPRVTTPTIIFHSKNDQVIPFAAGEYLARGIRGSTFVPLEGDNHILLEKEPAWETFIRLTRQFLGGGDKAFEAGLAKARTSEQLLSCTSSDGTKIAYSSVGEGRPLVMPAVWFHHIDEDLTTPTWAHWMGEATRGRRFIRSDMRGVGLSERKPPRWTFDALLEDFVAVVDDAGLAQFDLLGMSHGVLVAIAYAARFPERVRRLVLFGGYAEGFGVRGDPEEIKRRETLLNFGRGYAPSDRLTFARMLGALYWPGARGEMTDWFGERLQTISLLNEELQDVFRHIDLRPSLALIRAPTLIMHSNGDRIVPVVCSEKMAAGIAGAKLVLLKSENHIPLADEPAWRVARAALRNFLRDGSATSAAGPALVGRIA